MDLKNLKLNRFLYKDNSDLDSAHVDSTLYTQTQNNQGSNSGGPESPSGTQIQANSVAPNSVITASLIQSSGETRRIQIDPKDNTFRAIDNHGSTLVLITTDGIGIFDYLKARIFEFRKGVIREELLIQGPLVLSGEFIYKGIIEPVLYCGSVNGSSGAITQINMTGWSSAKNSTGDFTVTHNLGDDDYIVLFTPITGTPMTWSIIAISNTQFRVIFSDILGAPIDPVSFQFNLQNFT